MHQSVEKAIDEIDAAVFSSDTFQDDSNRELLMRYIDRWTKELTPHNHPEPPKPPVPPRSRVIIDYKEVER